jgi:hypothetical protein
MPSSRAVIRNGLVDHIKAKITGLNVYSNRVHDVSKAKLPMLNVITPVENFTVRSQNLLEYQYNLTVICQLVDKHSDSTTLNDNLDFVTAHIIKHILGYGNTQTSINQFNIVIKSVETSFIDELDKVYGSSNIVCEFSYQDSNAVEPAKLLLDDEGNPIPVYDIFGDEKPLLYSFDMYSFDIEQPDQPTEAISGIIEYNTEE